MGRAVVLGGSVAGLLAARALTDFHDEVVIVDRDALPPEVSGQQRRGVPHGRHLHGLLAGGLRAIEKLLPGTTDDLKAMGIPYGDMVENIRICANGVRMCRANSGVVGFTPNRPQLESYLRSRVFSHPKIAVLDRTDVVDIQGDGERVNAVVVHQALTEGDELLRADLVVDATGRGSRAVRWLERLNFHPPAEEQLRVDVTYTTRQFVLGPQDTGGDFVVLVTPTVENPRGGALHLNADGRAMVTLMGYLGDAAPTDLDGFLAYARSLPLPDLHDVIAKAEPLDDGLTFRFPASVRRRYEKLRRFPAGFLVVGDAVCSFNPLYGQGMTVAAMEAVVLRSMLAKGRLRTRRVQVASDLNPLRFFRAIAPIVDVPWQISVGADLVFPQIEGKRTAMGQFLNRYIARLQLAAAHDADLAITFSRVANMVARPPALLRPDRAVRVLLHGRR